MRPSGAGPGAWRAQGVAAPVAAPVVSRYALVGVLAGRDSGGGAAVIAVGNQPAKPFRVAPWKRGAWSVSAARRAWASVDGPASITLRLSLPDKR